MSIVGLVTTKVTRNARELQPLPQSTSSVTDALAAVAAYVPTEILAGYTLALGTADEAGLSAGWFVVFLLLTPAFVWLVFAVRSKEQAKPFWPWRVWPWWECAAATIAFTAWSAALPHSTFVKFTWYSAGAAAVALVITSAALPLLGAIVTKANA